MSRKCPILVVNFQIAISFIKCGRKSYSEHFIHQRKIKCQKSKSWTNIWYLFFTKILFWVKHRNFRRTRIFIYFMIFLYLIGQDLKCLCKVRY